MWNSSRTTRDNVTPLHPVLYVTVISLSVLAFLVNLTVFLVWKKHSGFSVRQNSFNFSMALANLYACIMVAVTFFYHWRIPLMSEDIFYSSWPIARGLLISRRIPFFVNYNGIINTAFVRFWEVKFPNKKLPKMYYIVSQLLTWGASLGIGGNALYSSRCWSYVDMCLMLGHHETNILRGIIIRITLLSVVTIIVSAFLFAGCLHHRKMAKLDPYILDSSVMVIYKNVNNLPEQAGPSKSKVENNRAAYINNPKTESQEDTGPDTEEAAFNIMTTISSRKALNVSTQPVFKQVNIRRDKPVLRRLFFIFITLILVFILSIIKSAIIYQIELNNQIGYNVLLILNSFRTLFFAFIPFFYFCDDDGQYLKVVKSLFICKKKKSNSIHPYSADNENYI